MKIQLLPKFAKVHMMIQRFNAEASTDVIIT